MSMDEAGALFGFETFEHGSDLTLAFRPLIPQTHP
jgi:hypothetical protein